MYKLYIYEHCPYCIKARMIFGFKDIPVSLEYLLNDDEKTPIELIGQKMVPILVEDDNPAMPESMDIVHYIDGRHGDAPIIAQDYSNIALNSWLEEAKNYIYPLAMPRWVKTTPPLPEFATNSAIEYFTRKKEAYLGDSFTNLIAKSEQLIDIANQQLTILAKHITSPKHATDKLSEYDIHIYAALHSLSVVKGLEYPPIIDEYRQYFAQVCKVDLLDKFAI